MEKQKQKFSARLNRGDKVRSHEKDEANPPAPPINGKGEVMQQRDAAIAVISPVIKLLLFFITIIIYFIGVILHKGYTGETLCI